MTKQFKLSRVPKKYRNFVALVVMVLAVIQYFIAGNYQPASPQPNTNNNVKSEATESAMVSRVVDGDTIQLSDGRKVRYIGVDTPETVDPRRPVGCFGKEASDKNKQLVEGKNITLEKDVSETDKYGRLLRYVYLDGQMVNEELVKQGYAKVDTVAPDVKYAEVFRQAEAFARNQNLGLWSSCPVVKN